MPIDIATGNVELDREDFSLPGRVPIKWVRSYRTTLHDQVPGDMGSGWTSNWFPTLKRSGADWIFSDRNGSQHLFEDRQAEIAEGKTIRLLGSYLELSSTGGRFEIVSWDVDSGEIERFAFEPKTSGYAFNLVAIENVSGDRVDVTWTSSGELESLHQQRENRTILVHYKAGRISALSLENAPGDPALVRYEYDQEGRLISAVNRRGFAHRYEYDNQSKLKRELLPDGAVYTYKYDDKNRCIHFTGLDHYNEKKLRFLDPVGTTILTNSYGIIKTFTALPSGQITSESTPIGAKRETKYDEFGRVVQRINELGAVTSYTYDDLGNRNSITDALGNVTEFAFNQFHQAMSIVDATGQTWKREFNDRHQLIATINPLGAQWKIEYDSESNPVQIFEPHGFSRTQRFEQGLLKESTDFMNNKSSFKWDEFGRLVEQTGPVGHKTEFHYDPTGNITQVDQSDGSSLLATYDAGENLSSFINAKGNSTRYRYGSCKRLLMRTDSIGRTVRYEWGSEPDRLDVVINEKGERFNYQRDDEGRVILERGFDDREHQFSYDSAGRCTAFTNGNQERIQYKRNLLGRLIEQSLPTGEKTTFEFDPIGRMVSAKNPDAEVKFEYDVAGRIVCETQNEHWVRTEYNLADEVVRTHTSLEHEVTYEVDPNGRVVRLTTNNEHSLTFERDARGLQVGRRMPGNVRLEQEFDSMGRLLGQNIGKSRFAETDMHIPLSTSRILPNFDNIQRSYKYDQDGWLLEIQDRKRGYTKYSYDPAERLLSVFRDSGPDEFLDYDDADNLRSLHQQDGSEPDVTLSYTQGNRLNQVGDTIYEHDQDGRLVRKTESATSDAPKIWEYYWDTLGQMRGLRRPDGNLWEYRYDPFGRRISKVGMCTEYRMVWSGNELVHSLGGIEKSSTWIANPDSFSPIAKVIDNRIYFVITDHVGTPSEVLDHDGEVVWTATHTTFGNLSTEKSESLDGKIQFRFQGQYFDDESGLHYNRFRYYDPQIGRFVSADPIGLLGGLNAYAYCVNPVSWIDPLGLAGERELGKDESIHRGMNQKNGSWIPSPPTGAPGGSQMGARTATSSQSGVADMPTVRSPSDKVGPSTTGNTSGLSANTNVQTRGINGTVSVGNLPPGLGARLDNPSSGHVTIYPTHDMSFEEFQKKLNSIPWEKGGCAD